MMPSLHRFLLPLVAALAVFGLVFAACGDDDDDDTPTAEPTTAETPVATQETPTEAETETETPAEQEELVIGALFDLTGDWSTLGNASAAALEIAIEEANDFLETKGVAMTVRAEVVDTGLSPDVALEELEEFHEQGIRIVVGPQSSSEVRAITDFANENDMLVISQGSTSSALSTVGDNVFRFTPDDRQAAVALVTMLQEDGIQAIVPTWRADVGNQGHHNSVDATFTAAGGVVTEGMEYATGLEDYSALIDELEAQLLPLIEEFGADHVGVFLAAFDDVVGVFNEASTSEALSSVRWYGSDGVALTAALIGDPTAAAFAVRAVYPNPIYGLDRSNEDRWQPLKEQILEMSGQDADAFALSVYDIVWVAVNAAVNAGGVGDIEALKQAFIDVAAEYDGVTGPTRLNEAGDRAEGPFDFWVVCEDNGGYSWAALAAYQPGPDGGSIIPLEGCP